MCSAAPRGSQRRPAPYLLQPLRFLPAVRWSSRLRGRTTVRTAHCTHPISAPSCQRPNRHSGRRGPHKKEGHNQVYYSGSGSIIAPRWRPTVFIAPAAGWEREHQSNSRAGAAGMEEVFGSCSGGVPAPRRQSVGALPVSIEFFSAFIFCVFAPAPLPINQDKLNPRYAHDS